MNRLSNCIKFETKKATKSTLIFMLFLLVFYTLSIVLTLVEHSNNATYSSMGFFMPFSIFLFINVSISYTPHYNFLLMLGNSRKTIMFSQFISYFIIAVGSVIAVALLELISQAMFKPMHFNYVNLLNIVYRTNLTFVSTVSWYLTLFMAICFFSLFLGAMRYKFGKIFSRIFWAAFALSWIFIPPLLMVSGNKSNLLNFVKYFFGVDYNNGIYVASANFLIVAIIFGIITYLIGIKQEMIVSEKN